MQQILSPPDREELEGLVGDPAVERFARRRKKSQGNQAHDILDELGRSGDE